MIKHQQPVRVSSSAAAGMMFTGRSLAVQLEVRFEDVCGRTMHDDLRLRRFRPDDLPAIIELFQETVRRVNGRDYSPEQVAAWAPDVVPTDSDRWTVLADRYTIVAESGGEIVGFTDLEPDGHIDRFFVHADRQGRGVGRAMLDKLIAEAERTGVRRLFAEVSITARPFFERMNFTVLAEQAVTVRGVSLTNYRMERRL